MEEGPSNGGMLYHEVQESKLCAVHCVNTVLQGPFFSELDLAAVASDLDRRERQIVLEAGAGSEELLSFEAEGSHNVSMDGDFSIQVLEKALEVWDLKVIPLDSPLAESARVDPQLESAFICHLHDHWFCIRKVNGEWYNFDSLYAAPQYLSKFFLSAYLDTLKGYGWSIFLVRGNFPKECPVSSSESLNGFGQWFTPEDAQRITKAVDLSHVSPNTAEPLQFPDSSQMAAMRSLSDKEEQDLNAAIAASLRDENISSGSQTKNSQGECLPALSSEPLNKFGKCYTSGDALGIATSMESDPSQMTVLSSSSNKEERDLNAAIAASLRENSANSVSKKTDNPQCECQPVSSSELLSEIGQPLAPQDAERNTKSAEHSQVSLHGSHFPEPSNPSQMEIMSSLLDKEDEDLDAAIALSLRDSTATSLTQGRSNLGDEFQ
ncbi:ataxin-3 homolog [Nymphaea colorata]|nr:ataxin-3 homolog [Nymphaea colorata]XP_049933927.1 ataxin-3 homolog [Nymphaea colorata]